jgi:hypothetical protein
MTGTSAAPKVSLVGWIWIDTNSWLRPQLFKPTSRLATAISTTRVAHFPFIDNS